MVDYSQWLEEVRRWNPVPAVAVIYLTGWIVIIVGIVMLIMLTTQPVVQAGCGSESSDDGDDKARRSMIRSIIMRLLIFFVGLAMISIGMWDYSHDPDRTTFTEQTEKTFGITRLVCDWGCPDYRLPDDRDTASWIRGNRLEHGRFIIEGSKVGLAGPDGTLLKESDGDD